METRENLIDWVIVGGESGSRARPCSVEWIRSIRDQCAATRTRLFIKQLGANAVVDSIPSAIAMQGRPESYRLVDGRWKLCCRDPKGGDPDEWIKDLRVQEMPPKE